MFSCFKRKKPEELTRILRANDSLYNEQFQYAKNEIKTSKYNVVTFLPKNLFEQFKRVANAYFLFLLILQLIPQISSLTFVTTVIPLLAVLAVTALKDLYDDIQRHLNDRKINNRSCHVVQGDGLRDVPWKFLKVGDVVILRNNDFVPADLLLLSSGEPCGLAYVETADLDGETNLKNKQCLVETTSLGDDCVSLSQFNGEIECDPPNNVLSKFNGKLVVSDRLHENAQIFQQQQQQNHQQHQQQQPQQQKPKFLKDASDSSINKPNNNITKIYINSYNDDNNNYNNTNIHNNNNNDNTNDNTTNNNNTNSYNNNQTSYALTNDNILLRGCRIRNTKWVTGVLIYAGKDTKLMKNGGKTLFKRTHIDRLMNAIIIWIFFFLLFVCLVCGIGSCVWELNVGYYYQDYLPWPYYIPGSVLWHNSGGPVGGAITSSLLVFLSFIIILNTLVPISLYVSVEIIRFVQSLFINWDLQMYHNQSDEPAKARTTALNEELGQIEYIFSDKTGTLTQNIMTFKKCSVQGIMYDIDDLLPNNQKVVAHERERGHHKTGNSNPIGNTTNNNISEYANSNNNNNNNNENSILNKSNIKSNNSNSNKHILDFFRLIAVCHTVLSSHDEAGKLSYQAQSPDESALVEAARKIGVVFLSRTQTTITIEVMGKREIHELLCLLDFDNDRKRMSVILKMDGHITLYCKGADSKIMERLNDCSLGVRKVTEEHLNEYASDGLRTLCLAYKRIDDKEYKVWNAEYHKASTSLQNRDELLNEAYEKIERDLTLLGATAIEDKLQDGVPQTIENLRMAGIKIWVLTGDKQETAINIGYSCKLMTEETTKELFIIDAESRDGVKEQIDEAVNAIKSYENDAVENESESNGDGLNIMSDNKTSNGFTKFFRNFFRNDDDNNDDKNNKSLNQRDNRNTINRVKGFDNHSFVIHDLEKSFDLNESYHHANNRNSVIASASPTTLFTNHLSSSASASVSSLSDCTVLTTTSAPDFALLITGNSLSYALSEDNLRMDFLNLGCSCSSVICCRVTPLQKSQVVELVKEHKRAVTLAIGDGANDVSMIKSAHIGVGISGQEGMQAVLSSDYSFGQFRFLERLLLVHGGWSYMRMAKFLKYFFYKNFAFTLCQFWFGFYSGFSAQTIYDPYFVSFFNLFYTSLPILALGVFDKDTNDRCSLSYPKLYQPGQINLFFNKKSFALSAIEGVLTSFVVFYVTLLTSLHSMTSNNGLDLSDVQGTGFTMSTTVVVVVTLKCSLETKYWTIFNHLFLWGSLVFYFLFHLLFYLPYFDYSYAGTFTRLAGSPQFWFSIILSSTILLIPPVLYKSYRTTVLPTLSDRLRVIYSKSTKSSANKVFPSTDSGVGITELSHDDDGIEIPSKPTPKPVQMNTGEITNSTTPNRRPSSARPSSRSSRPRSSYAFSHQGGFGKLITNGSVFNVREL